MKSRIRLLVSLCLVLSAAFAVDGERLSRPLGVTPAFGADSTIVIRDVKPTPRSDAFAWVLVNQTPKRVRDVRVLIRHTWHWADEFHPGSDSPGWSVYRSLDNEIPPGGSLEFTYAPSPPLTVRPDGYYETTIQLVGFTEVG